MRLRCFAFLGGTAFWNTPASRSCAVLLSCLILPAASSSAVAEVRLPHVLSDHAVLQRNQPLHIWGWAGYGEHVTVSFHNQKRSVQADDEGAWQVWLNPEQAGGPYTLTVSGDATKQLIERTDLLVGDVWVASGQSNMEMPLKGFASASIRDSDKEIAAANHPKIRLLLQSRRTSMVPIFDTENTWTECTPETAKKFSAVAYFFGRKISEEENVPVGLIDTTWGGTPAHSWISAEGLAWSNLTSVAMDEGTLASVEGRARAIRENFRYQDEAMLAAGKKPPQHEAPVGDWWGGSWTPAALFNGMVAPYVNYTVKGFLWYQGETDHEGIKALNYSRVFPALIQDWRKQWGQGLLPFLYVQISSFDGGEGWAAVRDAQRRTLELSNTAMVVTLDIGLKDNVHPSDKQTVGARLAQSALGMVYGKKVETASPLFVQATAEGTSIRAWFSHADGLMSKQNTIGDFEIAGKDRVFVDAKAKIEVVNGQPTVVATSPEVPLPLYIRYGWTPVVNSYLYNAAGLPMSTFTSETDTQMLLPEKQLPNARTKKSH